VHEDPSRTLKDGQCSEDTLSSAGPLLDCPYCLLGYVGLARVPAGPAALGEALHARSPGVLVETFSLLSFQVRHSFSWLEDGQKRIRFQGPGDPTCWSSDSLLPSHKPWAVAHLPWLE
jgi:hypothetical protein